MTNGATALAVKEYLFKKDITIKEFANLIGISTSYLYQLLRGERKPSLELAHKIEEVTEGEISVACWFSFDIKKKKPPSQVLSIQEALKIHEERISYIEGQFEAVKEKVESLERKHS